MAAELVQPASHSTIQLQSFEKGKLKILATFNGCVANAVLEVVSKWNCCHGNSPETGSIHSL